MESTRDRLAQHLLKRIVPLFEFGDPMYDPWWWPIGTGQEWKDWFPAPLTRAEVERAAPRSVARILASLQRGPYNRAPVRVNATDYAQFHGFWGEANVDGRIIAVVSIRPSRRTPYPGEGYECFPRLLHAIGCGGVHVTDIIKRRGPGREPLQCFPPGESPSQYADMLVDELLALGRADLHLIPMHATALQLLEDHNVTHALADQLGRRPTLSRLMPFPKDPNCEENIGKWRQALDHRPAVEKGKGWGFAVRRTLKDARAALGKMPRGFWKDDRTCALLKSKVKAEDAAKCILAGRNVWPEDLPHVMVLLQSDVVWYRSKLKYPQRDDEAEVSRIRKAYAALK